ncbi:hypothetical protein [Ornithinicoccus halotolerans]|uniref:hypothetical protein n=1 Tax=Ornithinicoccus halotolerans TaxID=1748220 RepID=UPI001E6576C3|nr:hypothetical protein [Ornithinicoccus halotolerans]
MRLGRLVPWVAFVVAAFGVAILGSMVAGVGGNAEGRDLQLVAPWAVPGLVLALLAAGAALRAALVGKGRRVAVVLALAVALYLLVILLINPAMAQPVP